jgi:imidazole glycerol-phosphate synthase subunit HisF
MRKVQILLLANRELYNSVGFSYDKYVGCPINNIRIYSDLGYDEIILLNVSRYSPNALDYEFLSRVVRASTVPISFGGGGTSLSTVKNLFRVGFDKVFVNSYKDLSIDELTKISSLSGMQSLGLCINYSHLRGFKIVDKIDNHGNLSFGSKTIHEELLEIIDLPIGEVLFQNVDLDGTLKGVDSTFLNFISNKKLPFQVLLSGGVVFSDYANLELNDFISLAHGSSGIYIGNLRSVLPNI